MVYDVTERVQEAWKYYDELLDRRIAEISERADVPLEQFVKINPAEFLEKNKYQRIQGYKYKKIDKWIAETKKDDQTFLISPEDAIEETAAQVSYKAAVEIRRTIRASKCEVVPCPIDLALDFFIRNHRQTAPNVRNTALCYGLSYKGEIVAVMLYDITNGAVRGTKREYELLRLSISKGTRVHGGASKLQGACEETLRAMDIHKIYSYSNATINSGAVYQKLGFSGGKLDGGQPFVIMNDNRIERLITLHPYSTDAALAVRGQLKTHIGGNKMWVKTI